MAKPKIGKSGKLTARQLRFCELYAGSEEFFANGVRAYAEAYGIDITSPKQYSVASSGACDTLKNPDILKKIDEIFQSRGLNDQYVDKQLEKLITQEVDFKVKLGAIKEYNVLKKRVSSSLIDSSKKVTGIKITFDAEGEENGSQV